MKKRVLSVVLALIFSMSCAQLPSAASDFGGGLPDGWEIQQTVGGAEAYTEDGALVLSCDNTASDARSAVSAASESYSINASAVVIRTEMQISADSDTEGSEKRTFAIGSSGNVLFSINAKPEGATVITALSGQAEFEFDKGVYHTITAAVDTESRLASVWCDDVNIYSGSAPSWLSKLALSDMRCYMLNRSTKYGGKSVWLIKSLSAYEQKEYKFSSEPQDGQLAPEGCAAVKIGFNAYMSPKMFDSAVLQVKNGDEYENTAALVKKSAVGAEIIPEEGFLPMNAYRIVISGITDIFGVDLGDKAVEFQIAPRGYTAPDISAELSSYELYEGQKLTVTACSSAAAGISEISLYINGAEAASVKAEGEYYEHSFSYVPQYAGTYSAEVIVTDIAGGAAREEMSFEVKTNTAPKIVIDGLENGRTYNSAEQLSSVEVYISDAEDNYESCEIYFNGSLFAEYTDKYVLLDLSKITQAANKLEVKAYDSAGKSSSAEYEYYYVKTVETPAAYFDFESYTGGTPSGMTNSASDKGGELNAVKIDSEHGTSLEVSSQTDQAAGDIGATVAYKYDTAGKIAVEMDLYMPTELAAFRLRYRNADSGVNLDIADFARGGVINLLGSGGVVENGAELTYLPKTWYHIKCNADTATGVYDLYINDKLVVSGRTGANAARITGMSYLRFSLYTENGDGGSFVVDNVRITSITEMPRITEISSPNGSGSVSYEDNEIDVWLSAGISENRLLQNITLSNEIGVVGISEVSYYPAEKYLKITPAVPLISNMEYTVILSGSITTDTLIPIENDIIEKFTTTKAAFDVESVRFTNTGEKISAAVEMVNSENAQKEVCIILTVWDNDRLTASAAVSDVINGGETSMVSVPDISKKGGNAVKLYVWSSLDGAAEAVSKKIFTN